MTATVELNADKSALVRISGNWPADTKFHIFCRNTKDNQYLGQSGWTPVATPVPAEVVFNDGVFSLHLSADTVAFIKPGSLLIAEDIFIGMTEDFRWPQTVVPVAAPVADAAIPPTLNQPPIATPVPSAAVAATVTTLAPEAPLPPEPQQTDAGQRSRRMGIAAALATGLLVGAGVMYFGMSAKSPVVQTVMAAPSPDLIAREKAVTEKEAALSEREKTTSQAATSTSTASSQIARLEANIRDLNFSLTDRDSRIAALQAQIQNAEKIAAPTPNASATLAAAQIAALAKQRDQLVTSLTEAQAALADTRQKLADREDELKKLQTQSESPVQAAPVPVNSSAADLAALTTERDSLKSTIDSLTLQLSSFSVDKANLQARLDQNEVSLSDLRTQLDAKNAALANAPGPGRAVWGAAVVGRDGSVQSSVNQISEESAIKVSQKSCIAVSGPGCSLVTSFQNTCFAVARTQTGGVKPYNWRSGVNPEWQQSASIAMERCERENHQACKIVFNVCTPDTLSAPE